MKARKIAGAGCVLTLAAGLALPAAAQEVSGGVVKIGILNDMSGPEILASGRTSAVAAPSACMRSAVIDVSGICRMPCSS